MIRLLALLVSVLALSACQSPNSLRVEPESLLSSSNENISFKLSDSSSVDSIEGWISDDKPTSAVLSCLRRDSLCADVSDLLSQNGVSAVINGTSEEVSSVELIYDRVTARQCNMGLLGCSVSVNSVQMVTDRLQFVKPVLSGRQSAAKSVEDYNNYYGK